MASIRVKKSRSGQNRYYVTIRMRGQHLAKVFDRKTDAHVWIQETESQIRQGYVLPQKETEKKTLAELIRRYHADVLSAKKASTQAVDKYRLRWWAEHYGHVRLRALTPELIEEAKSKLKSSGRGNGPTAVKRMLANLSHVLTKGVQWGWIVSSPMKKVEKPKEPTGRCRYLSAEELDALLDACRKSPNPLLYPAVKVAIGTGIRKGELRNLVWPSVDLKNRMIYLEDTKNGDRRGVPLNSEILGVFHELKRSRRLDTDLIFPSKNGKVGLEFRGAFRSALREAKIQNFHWHDLRHTFASYLVMEGASLLAVSTLLGHRDLSMTKRYTHLSPEYLKNGVELISDRISGKKAASMVVAS